MRIITGKGRFLLLLLFSGKDKRPEGTVMKARAALATGAEIIIAANITYT